MLHFAVQRDELFHKGYYNPGRFLLAGEVGGGRHKKNYKWEEREKSVIGESGGPLAAVYIYELTRGEAQRREYPLSDLVYSLGHFTGRFQKPAAGAPFVFGEQRLSAVLKNRPPPAPAFFA